MRKPKAPMQMIPPGTYKAKIVEAELARSMQGNKMIRVVYETEYGDRVISHISLLPQAIWRLKKLLHSVAITKNKTGDYTFNFDTDDLLNRELMIIVGTASYQGRIYNQVQAEFRITDEILNDIQNKELSKIDMREILKVAFNGIDENSLDNLLAVIR